MSFEHLDLSQPLIKALHESGYTSPTPIQAKAIPAVRQGKDVLAAAQTGTGKTAAFTLPIIENLLEALNAKADKPRPKGNFARALVLTPTRELAIQVAQSVERYSQFTAIKSTVVYGGVKINPQMMKLRGGVDILVATPGRLLDLVGQGAVKLSQIEIFTLDEADRMLDMGFIHDIRKVINMLPPKRQNLMFSATFSKSIRELANTIIHNPVEISVSSPNSASVRVEQKLHPVDKKQKPELLTHLIKQNDWQQLLVFSRTKHGANKLVKILNHAGIDASAIHGNKSQGARTKALAGFKSGEVRVLVATDIASRGIDINELPLVVNIDLPQVAEDYVHRIGRTGRAGASGLAVSLVSADEADILFQIEKLTKAEIPREFVEGFEPLHSLPSEKVSWSKPGKNAAGNRKPKRNTKAKSNGEGRSGENNPRKKTEKKPGEANRSGSPRPDARANNANSRGRGKPSGASNTGRRSSSSHNR